MSRVLGWLVVAAVAGAGCGVKGDPLPPKKPPPARPASEPSDPAPPGDD